MFGLRTPPGFEASLPGLQQAITQEEGGAGCLGSGPPLNGFEASLPGLQQAITQEEAPSGRRSWSLVGGGIGRGSLTARLGSIASTCMFVQLAKGITQSRGALSSVLLEESEQFRTIQNIVAS